MLTGCDFENISLLVGFENIVASSISRKDLRQYEGQSIAAIAQQQGKDPFTALFDLLQAAHCDVTMITISLLPRNIRISCATHSQMRDSG